MGYLSCSKLSNSNISQLYCNFYISTKKVPVTSRGVGRAFRIIESLAKSRCYILARISKQTNKQTHTHIHTYTHTHINTYTHTHIHTYIHTYTHTHIHTYTHTH